MRTHIVAIFALAALAACGERDHPETAASSPGSCASAPAGGVVVSGAWVRAAGAGQRASAVYLTLCNSGEGPDRLLGVSTDAAEAAEIHQTRKDEAGVASMAPLESVDLAPKEDVALAPGGAHIMLIGLKRPIEAGDTVTLTLEFERSAPQTIEAHARGLDDAGHQHP